MTAKDIMLANFLESENAMQLLEETQPFMELMMQYKCALHEVRTKFEVLNDEFSVRFNRNPVEAIKTRVKTPLSIVEKLKRQGRAVTLDNIRHSIFDVAGARIICSFRDDIYSLANMFTRQDDVKVHAVKDYIKSPKANGYRSLHLIVEVPIFLSSSKEHMKVEVQFRTIAMDFWASLEHKLKYKKDVQNPEEIAAQLKECAEGIANIDKRMMEIRCQIGDE